MVSFSTEHFLVNTAFSPFESSVVGLGRSTSALLILPYSDGGTSAAVSAGGTRIVKFSRLSSKQVTTGNLILAGLKKWRKTQKEAAVMRSLPVLHVCVCVCVCFVNEKDQPQNTLVCLALERNFCNS